MEYTIFVWKWRKDHSKLIVAGQDIFDNSESFASDWIPIAKIDALNPLTRPIPTGYHLYLSERLKQFPYNTTEIKRIDNLFYPPRHGKYFLARDADVEGLRKYAGLHVK